MTTAGVVPSLSVITPDALSDCPVAPSAVPCAALGASRRGISVWTPVKGVAASVFRFERVECDSRYRTHAAAGGKPREQRGRAAHAEGCGRAFRPMETDRTIGGGAAQDGFLSAIAGKSLASVRACGVAAGYEPVNLCADRSAPGRGVICTMARRARPGSGPSCSMSASAVPRAEADPGRAVPRSLEIDMVADGPYSF